MRILAFSAHPDDAVLTCGGTLAKYALAGQEVSIALVCQGDSTGSDLAPDDLRRKRETELRRSAGMINASVYCLGYPDFHVPGDEEARLRVVEIMRQVEPDLVITHSPQDYLQDHRRTCELVEECLMMSASRRVVTQSPPFLGFPPICYMDTVSGLSFDPDEFVDISPVFELKRKMLECLETDVAPYRGHPVLDTMEWVEITARFRGIQSGVRYAEAFARSPYWGSSLPTRLLP